MTNIIAAIIFIIISVTMIAGGTAELRYYYHNQNKVSYVKQEAREIVQYSNAVFNYITAYGLPLSQSNLSVSNLKTVNLLPETFPNTTPFGQSFTTNYNTDVANPNIEDVIIRPSGAFNNDELAKAGLKGTLGYNYVAGSVLAGISIPPYPNSTGTYVGIVSANEWTGDGQNISLSWAATNIEPSIYIKAPDQYGYWLINFITFVGGYGYDAFYSSVFLRMSENIISNTNNVITSEGFYTNCPSYGTVVNSSISYNSPLSQQIWNENLFSNQDIYCFPAYKDEVSSFSLPMSFQYFDLSSPAVTGENLAGDYLNNYYNGLGATPINYLEPTNNYFVSPSEINGYEYPTFGIGSVITTAWLSNSPPPNTTNFLPPAPAYSSIGEVGFQLDLINPQGQNVVYQIAEAGYSLITGPGCVSTNTTLNSEYDEEYGLTTPLYYNLDGPYNSALCDSVGNSAFGWTIQVNPTNADTYTFPAGGNANFPEYEDEVNSTFYTVPLTVNTSNVYN